MIQCIHENETNRSTTPIQNNSLNNEYFLLLCLFGRFYVHWQGLGLGLSEDICILIFSFWG